MADRRKKQTKLIALCSMLSALGVVLIACSAFFDVLDLTVAAVASLFTVFAVMEIGGIYPWLIFAVTGILSLMILPSNPGAYCYVLFFGHYPMIKSRFERRLRPLVAWIFKLIFFNIIFSGYLFLFPLFLPTEFFDGVWYIVLAYLLGNLLMVLYDLALTKLVTAYLGGLRERLHISRWLK